MPMWPQDAEHVEARARSEFHQASASDHLQYGRSAVGNLDTKSRKAKQTTTAEKNSARSTAHFAFVKIVLRLLHRNPVKNGHYLVLRDDRPIITRLSRSTRSRSCASMPPKWVVF